MLEIKAILEDCRKNPKRAAKIWSALQDALKIGQVSTGDKILDFSIAIAGKEYEKIRNLLVSYMQKIESMKGGPAVLVHLMEDRRPTGDPMMRYLMSPPDHVKLTYIFCLGFIDKAEFAFKDESLLLSEKAVESWGLPNARTDISKRDQRLFFPIAGVRKGRNRNDSAAETLELDFGFKPDASDRWECGHRYYCLAGPEEILGFCEQQRLEHGFADEGMIHNPEYSRAIRAFYRRLGYEFPLTDARKHDRYLRQLVDAVSAALPNLEMKIAGLLAAPGDFAAELAPYIALARSHLGSLAEAEIGEHENVAKLRLLISRFEEKYPKKGGKKKDKK